MAEYATGSCCQGEKHHDQGPGQSQVSCGPSKDDEMVRTEEGCCGGSIRRKGTVFSDEDFVIAVDRSGKAPVKKTTAQLTFKDHLATIKVRCGLGRNRYAIKPGLYSIGTPDDTSPVLVSANYKLSFDHLRRELVSIDAWILVLDTDGVNVWCAAGKGTFATDELLAQIEQTGLADRISHRRVIVPQLGATGISGYRVKQTSGFKVVWGPVYAKDIPEFLASGLKSTRAMKQVHFPLRERLVLTPVELKMLVKPAFLILAALALLSGIDPHGYSLNRAIDRGSVVLASGLLGILAGTVMTPVLLPWVPFRSFYLKGLLVGLMASGVLLGMAVSLSVTEGIAAGLFTTALSSNLAMNFTGSTPYTSPSGVEKEMKQGLPVQLLAIVVALLLWLLSPFI